MNSMIEIFMVLIVLSNMAMLGVGRLRTCIHLVAFQGMLLGVFAYFIQEHITWRIILIADISFILKGFVFPALLYRPTRMMTIRRENDPFVGYSLSLLLGLIMLGISLWLSTRIPVQTNSEAMPVVPAAIMSMLTGLFLIVARKNALTQCIGYIVLENGIYLIGLISVAEIPVLVELGILLDVFVAVLVMGIAIHHIHRELHHIDADKLDTLKG